MNRQIHVMQIIDSMNFGGAEVMLRELTSGILTRGYHVSVYYSTRGPIAEELEAMGVSVTHLPRMSRVDPMLLWRIFREARHGKPDIVHTHLFKSDLHGRLAARLAGIPVVISTLHSCHKWAKNPILGTTYGANAKFADGIIAVSDEVRNYAIRHFHINPAKVTTIPNGIKVDSFKNSSQYDVAIRREFNIPMQVPVIGIVARLVIPKDHENFLRAAESVLQVNPETRFMIVGEGPLRSHLKALADSLGISKSVIFCGSRKDIPAILGTLSILVFSSLWEGLPVALLEGMAANLPIVATAVGGIPEVLTNDVTGLLVPPANPQALAHACIRLLQSPVLCRRLGQAALAHVSENYSLDTMVDRTAQLYQVLLQNARH